MTRVGLVAVLGVALLLAGACGPGDDVAPPQDDEVVLRYETSSRTKDHRADVELVLHGDGRLFVGFGGAPLGTVPVQRLTADEVTEIRRRLVDEGYAELESPQVDDRAEDGMDRVLTAPIAGRLRTLRFEGVSRPLLDDLQRLASASG